MFRQTVAKSWRLHLNPDLSIIDIYNGIHFTSVSPIVGIISGQSTYHQRGSESPKKVEEERS